MKQQEIIIKLHSLIDDNQLFSSLILNSKSQELNNELADEIIRYAFCANKSKANDDCLNCKHANQHSIMDTIYIGDGSTAIKKDEVQKIIEQMSMTAVESNGDKFYIIANAENLKLEAANSLLKFLEEPPSKTYAILLSNDRSKILQTIKSRCKLFIIENIQEKYEHNKFEKILLSKKKETYLLACNALKKIDKKELIHMVEESYSRTIIKEFPQFAEATIIFIEDLKFISNINLSIENYFITISEAL